MCLIILAYDDQFLVFDQFVQIGGEAEQRKADDVVKVALDRLDEQRGTALNSKASRSIAAFA